MPRNTRTQRHPAYGSLLLAMTIEPEEIGRRIKAARDKQLWTQMGFAQVANVSVSTVQRWESGQLPPVRELIRIAELLKVDPGEFVEIPAQAEPLTRENIADVMNEWVDIIRVDSKLRDELRLDRAETAKRFDETQEMLRMLMASVHAIEQRLG